MHQGVKPHTQKMLDICSSNSTNDLLVKSSRARYKPSKIRGYVSNKNKMDGQVLQLVSQNKLRILNLQKTDGIEERPKKQQNIPIFVGLSRNKFF